MRSLVLSGGGNKGAAQAVVIKYLTNECKYKYNSIHGISVGALNGSFLSMFSDDEEGANKLIDFWSSLKDKQVKKQWCPFGVVSALWKNSVYNSQPLINLVKSYLSLDKIRASGKKITVSAVSLTTGNYKVFSEKDDCFIDAVLASSSFPAMLNPIDIAGELYTDGGVKHITPLKEAIDAGATEIDMIICAPKQTTAKYNKKSNALKLASRTIDLMTDEIIEADLKKAQLYNEILLLKSSYDGKRFVKINVYRPINDLTEDSLDFSPETIKMLMEKGKELIENKQ